MNRDTHHLLNKKEAAAFLNIHPRTLDGWVCRRLVPFYKLGRGRNAPVRFKLSDLDTMLEQCRVGSAPR